MNGATLFTLQPKLHLWAQSCHKAGCWKCPGPAASSEAAWVPSQVGVEKAEEWGGER